MARRSSKPHDAILSLIDYETTLMFQQFRKSPSFGQVSQALEVDERTVSRSMLDINKAFGQRGISLLERTGRGYSLTHEGTVLVEQMTELGRVMRSLVGEVEARFRRIPIKVTSNCLDEFERLQNRVSLSNIELEPDGRRTAELNDSDDIWPAEQHRNSMEYPIAMFSIIETRRPGLRAGVPIGSGSMDLLPVKEPEPFRLVTSADVQLPENLTIADVIEKGVVLVVPDGGAAWRYLEREVPLWYRRRPNQHVSIPDLDFGLKYLARRLARTAPAAMVVHGVTSKMLAQYALESWRTHRLQPTQPHREFVAVTGIFRVEPSDGLSPRMRENVDIVWGAAKELFEKEVTHEP